MERYYKIDMNDLQDKDISGSSNLRPRIRYMLDGLSQGRTYAQASEVFSISATRVGQIWMLTSMKQARRQGRTVNELL